MYIPDIHAYIAGGKDELWNGARGMRHAGSDRCSIPFPEGRDPEEMKSKRDGGVVGFEWEVPWIRSESWTNIMAKGRHGFAGRRPDIYFHVCMVSALYDSSA